MGRKLANPCAEQNILRRQPEIKTPIVTANDLIKKLSKLKAQAHGGDTDLTFKLGEEQLIVTNVRWNELGDEIEVTLKGAG